MGESVSACCFVGRPTRTSSSKRPSGSDHVSSAYRKTHTFGQHRGGLNGGMTYSKPAETTTAERPKTVADEGWSVVGVLDRLLSRLPLRAVDELAARASGASTAGRDMRL